jgi:hypothetical protein
LLKGGIKMACKNCKTCKHLEFKVAKIDEHLTGFAFYCSRYQILGDSSKELLEIVKEEN